MRWKDGFGRDQTQYHSMQERRVIIISCVRSNTEFVREDVRASLGFVASPKRFNGKFDADHLQACKSRPQVVHLTMSI